MARSAAPTPDERTRYSSRRDDPAELEAWPEFDADARALLESVGEALRPEAGELLWDGGDAYDLYLVLAGGICLVVRRDERVSFVVEAGGFVGELGMLMGQPVFLAGVAMADTALLRVPIEDLHRLMVTSPATATTTCSGCRSSPSAIMCPTGRCCARMPARGPSSPRPARSRTRARLW